MESSLSQFKFAQFQFLLKAVDSINLPVYKGSTFRGAFGHAFKKIVCVNRERLCDSCLLRGKCVYSYVFETPPPSDTSKMRKYPYAPHPFVITPPLEEKRTYRDGEALRFELTLIGRSIDYLPYFIYTFDELGRMGIGKAKGKYQLEEVRADEKGEGEGIEGERKRDKGERENIGERTKVIGEGSREGGERSGDIGERIESGDESFRPRDEGTIQIYSGKDKTLRNNFRVLSVGDLLPNTFHLSPSSSSSLSPFSLHLVFMTPTRLKFDGDLSSKPEFHVLFRNLLRRISLLSYFHCGQELDLDFKGLIEKSKEIKVVKSDLTWYDWERYSNRQETKMMMGGFIGSISFEGDLEPFLPFLLIGEYVHVGKGTSFGLGKYEIEGPLTFRP